MFDLITSAKNLLLFLRAKRDLHAIYKAFDLDFSKSEAIKVLHGMYNHIVTPSRCEDAFEAAYCLRGTRRERVWLYTQFIIAKGDLSPDHIFDQLNSFSTFSRMVNLFGMEKVGVMLTVIPDHWWDKNDRFDTGTAGSVC